VSATLPAGTSITVTVESDPDDDETFEVESDPIALDGSGGPYDISGLTLDSADYRLHVTFETADAARTPTFEQAEIAHSDA
jgi:hypothetical protein